MNEQKVPGCKIGLETTALSATSDPHACGKAHSKFKIAPHKLLKRLLILPLETL